MFEKEIEAFEQKKGQIEWDANLKIFAFFKDKEGFTAINGKIEKLTPDDEDFESEPVCFLSQSLEFFSHHVTPELFAELLAARAARDALNNAIFKIQSVMRV